jgi:hypothetical protein
MILHLHSTRKKMGYISSNRSGVDHIYSAVPYVNLNCTVVKKCKTGAAMLIQEFGFR